MLDSAGAPPVSFDFLKGYVGYHLVAVFGDVFPGHTPEQMEEWIRQYRTIYLARGHAQTSVYPGVAEALAALGGRKGTATTKGTPTTRLVLEQFGLLGYFDHVQGTDGFPSKPAPDVILKTMEALGARPEECLMVGDSEADMEAGRAAGIKTCAVLYGYGKRDDFWHATSPIFGSTICGNWCRSDGGLAAGIWNGRRRTPALRHTPVL